MATMSQVNCHDMKKFLENATYVFNDRLHSDSLQHHSLIPGSYDSYDCAL